MRPGERTAKTLTATDANARTITGPRVWFVGLSGSRLAIPPFYERAPSGEEANSPLGKYQSISRPRRAAPDGRQTGSAVRGSQDDRSRRHPERESRAARDCPEWPRSERGYCQR